MDVTSAMFCSWACSDCSTEELLAYCMLELCVVLGWDRVRARPKSQMVTVHSLLMSTLEGFRSLWMTLAEWRKLMPQRRL